MLFPGKIYTSGKNFTLPPAVTAGTNITSGLAEIYDICDLRTIRYTKGRRGMKLKVFFDVTSSAD